MKQPRKRESTWATTTGATTPAPVLRVLTDPAGRRRIVVRCPHGDDDHTHTHGGGMDPEPIEAWLGVRTVRCGGYVVTLTPATDYEDVETAPPLDLSKPPKPKPAPDPVYRPAAPEVLPAPVVRRRPAREQRPMVDPSYFDGWAER